MSNTPAAPSAVPDEHVLGFSRQALDSIGSFQGVSVDDKYRQLLSHDSLGFKHREKAEVDPTFKQIIPYHLIFRPTHEGGPLVVLGYYRTKKSGEQRLKGKFSVGIGGHINHFDAGLEKPQESLSGFAPDYRRNTIYRKGAERELSEEINVTSIISERIIGYINDDSNEVGQVHFGVIHAHKLQPWGGVSDKEDHLQLVGFRDVDTTYDRHEVEMENWTKMVLAAIREYDLVSDL